MQIMYNHGLHDLGNVMVTFNTGFFFSSSFAALRLESPGVCRLNTMMGETTY